MIKLLTVAGLMLACSLAVSQPPQEARAAILLNAQRVGGCQAVFETTQQMLTVSLRSMKATGSKPSQEEFDSMKELHDQMDAAGSNFVELMLNVVVVEGSQADMDPDLLLATRKEAYEEQMLSMAHFVTETDDTVKKSPTYGMTLSPAIRMCSRWFQRERSAKLI